jgi:hypothetical protein
MYYMVDAQHIRPDQAMKVKQWVHFYPYVLPPDKAMVSFATKGMERCLGSTSQPSCWALSYIHIKWLNGFLEDVYHKVQDVGLCQNMTMVAVANLIAYPGWLQGGDIFEASNDNLVITAPAEVPTRRGSPSMWKQSWILAKLPMWWWPIGLS